MNFIESRNEICMSCSNIVCCMVFWGPDCKRQGGKKIPRIKSLRTEVRDKTDKIFYPGRSDMYYKTRNQVMKMFDQINTKMVKW